MSHAMIPDDSINYEEGAALVINLKGENHEQH